MDYEEVDFGDDEPEEQGFVEDQREEVLRPRTDTREYRRKIREVVIKGDTPRPKAAPTPPWYPRLERWETVSGITPNAMQNSKKWEAMKKGMHDAGFGSVTMPCDYYITPRKGHTVVSRLRKDAIEELMVEETPEKFFPRGKKKRFLRFKSKTMRRRSRTPLSSYSTRLRTKSQRQDATVCC
eukprot:5591911-Amphidinium_carterae.12